MSDTLPALFISHGSPMLAIEDRPARGFLAGLGATIARPKAILVLSAHWGTTAPVVSAAPQPETIHDFGGFPDELYRLHYPAPGAPVLAARVADLLTAAGLPCALHPSRGLDHGAWIPLMLMYPAADIPVAQLAIQPRLDPAHHARLGAALRPLRDEGVLILASGAMTHNLREVFMRDPRAATPEWTTAFVDWFAAETAADHRDALLEYRARAPHAQRNHPTDEHLLPFHAALGAGTPGVAGRRIHASYDHGVMAMDAYAFG